MNVHDYLIDHTGFDWATLLGGWARLLPNELTVWLMNRFGDLFLVYSDGSVHMLDVGGGTVARVADSRDDFATQLDLDDNANRWLLIPFVDELVQSGLILNPGQCYGYKWPPVVGGEYSVENSFAISIAEHLSFHADFHNQIKDLLDGAQVHVKVVN